MGYERDFEYRGIHVQVTTYEDKRGNPFPVVLLGRLGMHPREMYLYPHDLFMDQEAYDDRLRAWIDLLIERDDV